MVFPVVIYGCESWTIRKVDRRRIDAFELWCWRSILRVRWTSRRTNKFLLEEIEPGYSLESAMLKSKLRYFGRLMRRHDSLENSLMLGKLAGKRRRGRQKLRWIDGITQATNPSLTRLREITEGRTAWKTMVHEITKSRSRLND
ncbi:hypothetical protein M514_08845 [Trichuris suis]|uniref:Reverse transcriptase domain-containing protein n=1 Tax=Trichuris suis TaxID=68888 RepID=A0A085LZ21_9BILA|nr:hypothetical protein M513_08845 [Trichuris suis]KFD59415.1 hypothetical protein M514_08845 [Trichuris suis]